jgi:hypothetical protein
VPGQVEEPVKEVAWYRFWAESPAAESLMNQLFENYRQVVFG